MKRLININIERFIRDNKDKTNFAVFDLHLSKGALLPPNQTLSRFF